MRIEVFLWYLSKKVILTKDKCVRGTRETKTNGTVSVLVLRL